MEVEGGHKEAMRPARLEQGARVRRAIEEKERDEREEGKMKMEFTRLHLVLNSKMSPSSLLLQKNSQPLMKQLPGLNVSEPADENLDPNKMDKE